MLKILAKKLLPSALHPALRVFRWWTVHLARETEWFVETRVRGVAVGLQDTWERFFPHSLDGVRFASPASPRVSIVIPVHNQYRFTARCLASLAETATEVSYELIVVDDRSTDATAKRLGPIEGLRLERNTGSGGFVHACNRGLGAARGELVLFLNNDTTVEPGWLDHLTRTFDTFPRAGVVGAQLRFANGRLQEAGGIVWRDGSAWNYGRFLQPDDPRVGFARQVDYCSGACLLARRDLLEELGGFDTCFAPGYYEDTDLAFRARAAGHEVWYQPLARVWHYEGGTAGRSLEAGMKRYQVEHRQVFFERWRDVLAAHRPNGEAPELEKERRVEKRLLVVEPRMIRPDRDAGSLRMLHWIEIFQAQGYKVTFAPDNMQRVEPYVGELQARGVEVLYAPFVRRLEAHLAAVGEFYDVVLVSRLEAARRHLKRALGHCPQALVVFDTVDLHFVRERREAELEESAAKRAVAEATRRDELAAARAADVTVVVSEAERRLLLDEAPDLNVHVVSTIHRRRAATTGPGERRDLLFVGGFEHPPNTDAVRWMAETVMPLVAERRAEARLRVVGSGPPPEVLELASERVEIVGYVPDLTPYLEGCRMSVAPLRYGAGVKGKINHSLAHGLPVVATPIACEGMQLEDGRDVLVADDAEAFADAICRLYDDDRLWLRLVDGGHETVERCYSFAVAESATSALLEQPRRRRGQGD